jgi:hypothetical protein
MDVSETLKTYVTAEAKSVGSEEINQIHVFIGITNLLLKWEVITKNDQIYSTARKLHELELAKKLEGFKTPLFSDHMLKIIEDIESVEALLNVGEKFHTELNTFRSSENNDEVNVNIQEAIAPVGGFHEVKGPRVGRLPKYMPNKVVASQIVDGFLLQGEEYVWDGVYNTKDFQLSTRRGAQSLGRVFVTNLRLIFWSDDEDKPHLGVLYKDIESWKTSWMPMKTRGVIMYVDGQKVVFAANSTTMEHATKYFGKSR